MEILTIGSQGTVLAPANAKGEVEVQAGILKLKVNISQLRLVKQQDKPKPQPTSVHLKTGAMERTVRMECDVRGMALDEAIMTVDQYLDQAILAGMGEVSIIHGKGTGVLRSGIQQHLKHHMHVGKLPPGRLWGRGERGHDCDAEIILLSEDFFIRRRGFASAGAKPLLNTRKLHEEVTNSIARMGVQRDEVPLVGSRGEAPCGGVF